jgi:hypothetical protein
LQAAAQTTVDQKRVVSARVFRVLRKLDVSGGLWWLEFGRLELDLRLRVLSRRGHDACFEFEIPLRWRPAGGDGHRLPGDAETENFDNQNPGTGFQGLE